MPELPEVETIRRELILKVRNKKIKDAEVTFSRFINVSPKEFARTLVGAKIIDVKRRAKLLIFNFSNGWSLINHLKLTGQLIYNGKSGTGKPHIVYTFTGGSQLKHYDFRKFGYARLVKTDEVEKYLEKENFGPEPLEQDFTLEKFKELLKKRPKALIKPLLMDQTFIAGIGNVYAQEACFCAKVLPTRKVGTLQEQEVKNLYRGLIKILKESIKYKGSSVDTYVDIVGERGGYASKLKVYGRGGEKCLRCGAVLKEIKLGGRGTVFCPKCQY